MYVELPGNAEVEDYECGKLTRWLCGCRPAAQAKEEHYSELLKNHGFKRLKSVPEAFVHEIVHGDGFVWEGRDEDLDWMREVLEDKYELESREGFGPNDVRKIDQLGRVTELAHEGIAWRGGPRHCDLMQKHFGMDDKTKVLTKNGYEGDPEKGELRETELSVEECKVFRMLAARRGISGSCTCGRTRKSEEC